jgi:nuclear pore complex protein Nup98-Nup96
LFGGGATTNTTGGFGGNTGGGLFGQQQNKPAFGAANTGNTGGLFGGGNTNTSFGQAATTTPAFGGFGANAKEANNGTASTPFEAVIEKDGTTGTQHFQTITFQPKYNAYSLEELRLADYAQGRRYGNQNGQAGAFGQSTGFGGFGNTNTQTNTNQGGGLFGAANTNTTTGGFGANTGGFGATNNTNTGGGLFGQAKPATGGLFGTAATTTQPTGGLFGAAANTNSGGFGATNTAGGFGAANTGGGLFGQQNQTQAKPAFGGGFGTTATTGTTGGFGAGATTGFGQQNQTTGGGLFGNSTSTAPAFGGAQQQQNTTGSSLFGGGGGFGQQNQQQQSQTQNTGGLFGGFGNSANTQQKPSLFGGTTTTPNTGGSLFGGQQNTQPQQQTGGLFGNTSQQQPQQQTGGLFGAKPAATGGSLFGNTNSSTTGGGLFGNLNTNQNQQNQGSGLGLFGNQNQQQQKPSLFGAAPAANTGSLFGGQTNTNQSSLFGGSQQQQPQQQMNNSLLGNSQQSGMLTTSLNQNPYGNESLFSNTFGASTPNIGPIATPLSSSQKVKKAAPLPQHKLNPAASTRLITPQKRGGTYGFSYSTYGTPGSAYSPAFGNSLLGSQRSLGKSMSTSNLRNSYNPEDSILSPGAFSRAGPDFVGSSSLKRLNINRNIKRPTLFGEEQYAASPVLTQKKSVSFDNTANGTHANGLANGATTNGATTNGTSTALVRTEVEEPTSPPAPATNGATTRAPTRPPMEQISGNELAVVPENGASGSLTKENALATQKDQALGDYWTEPPINELLKMSPQALKKVANFRVGRQGVGSISFLRPVDLTTVDLNDFFDKVVVMKTREATVYGPMSNVMKAAPGTGLNVPSRITLENSFPRSRAGRLPVHEKKGVRFQKHIDRLKRIANTHFVDFNGDTGEWIFEVQHFSTYGLFDDDDESYWDDDETELSAAPDTPTLTRTPAIQGSRPSPQDISMVDSSPDDTFEFKKGKRASLPGGFGDETLYDVDEDTQSFLGDGSVGSLEDGQEEDVTDASGSELDEELNMAGSFSGPVQTTEQTTANEPAPFVGSTKPKSILKASQVAPSGLGTPAKATAFAIGDDWAEQLQRTISPKKQNRQALRESQGAALRELDDNIPRLAQSARDTKPIANHIDLMNSLFGQDNSKVGAKRDGTGKGFEV